MGVDVSEGVKVGVAVFVEVLVKVELGLVVLVAVFVGVMVGVGETIRTQTQFDISQSLWPMLERLPGPQI